MHKILVVEDEPALRKAYQMVLTAGPYNVDTASDGKKALEKCSRKKYDLVLLDLMMPVMDGVGFLKGFSLPNGKLPTKVMVLSNLTSGEELRQALTLGAHRNMLKSDLSPTQLLTIIRSELKTK